MTPLFTVPKNLEPFQHRVQVGQVGLHVYDTVQPQNRTFVLIHGLGDEADSWRKVFEPLSGFGRVVAPDLPGFGRSDHPRRAYTLEFYAETMAALLQTLKVSRAILVGNSMGAAVALRLTLRRPDLSERLVLVDGPPVRGKLSKAQMMFALPGQGEKLYKGFRASQDAAYDSLRPYYGDLDSLSEADRAFLRERVWDRVWSDDQCRAYLSTFRWMLLEGLRGHPRQSDLASIQQPVHLIWGDSDRAIPLEAAQLLQGWMPRSQLSIIPNCGHLPQQERPEELVRLVVGR
ncbi:MAG: alpha/beta hydrolase [Meiothermus sp.]|nr:alpha/beta hydrolase [Meiothermus sp.]